MINTNYSVDILINDKPVRKFPFDNKLFIEARELQEYTIRIKNNSFGRIMAVTSVDGLDTINGEKATENGNGYVINGYSSISIDGFRVSKEKVAKFVFDVKNKSYAASKNDGSINNTGVIGIRIIDEAQDDTIYNTPFITNPITPWEPYWPTYPSSPAWPNTCYSANSSNVCSSDHKSINNNSTEFDLGTKWGSAKESNVVEVSFQKGDMVFSIDIFYAARQQLIEMGVPIINTKQVSFPSSFIDSKYSAPPPGWQG